MDFQIAKIVAKVKQQQRKVKKKFGLVDGIHFATAEKEGAIFVTSDRDFDGLHNALLV